MQLLAYPIPSQSNKRGKSLKYVEQQAALPLHQIFAVMRCIALQCCAPASDLAMAATAFLVSDPS